MGDVTPADATPDISLAIVTYNVPTLLRRCLASIPAALGALRAEVLVVDNGLGDGTWPWLARLGGVRAIRGSPVLGFGAAANLALKEATGRCILILNPDTLLPPDSLQVLVNRLESGPDTGIIGPKLILDNGEMDRASRRAFPTPSSGLAHLLRLDLLFPRVAAFGRYNLLHVDSEKPLEIDAVSGAFMLIRREVLDQLRGFDPAFWMYGEDIDFCYRAKKAGWRTVYEPAVKVLHSKGASSAGRRLRTRYEFYRAMAVFYRKHQAAGRSPLVNFLVNVGIFTLGSATVSRELAMGLFDRARGVAARPRA